MSNTIPSSVIIPSLSHRKMLLLAQPMHISGILCSPDFAIMV